MRRAAALALALAGCSPAAEPRARAFLDELRADPTAFVAEVARARGAPPPSVPLRLDDDAAFAAAVRRKIEHDALAPVAGDTTAFAVAFGLDEGPLAADAAVTRVETLTGDELADEQLLGFYDHVTREVHVRAERLRQPGRGLGSDAARFVLAHEVGHALQHQRLGPRLMAMPDAEDARLAWNAVLEGEATLTALAHVAQRRRRPLRRVAARVGDVARSAQANGLARSAPQADALRRAAALDRERLLFPYEAGLAFVTDLLRAGGVALVERALVTPPTTSEQVLSPQRYLDGEQAVPVDLPSTPAGTRSLASGSVGQLLTGVVLGRCLPREQARAAARGWGGDAFRVVADDAGRAGLLWSTTWDDEEAAGRFSRALEGAMPCLRRASTAASLSIAPRATASRTGRHVALVRGLADAPHEPLLAALLSLPRPPVPARPIAPGVVIPPTPARPEPGPWLRAPASWDNPYLGLRVPAWEGFIAESGDAPTTLTLKRRGDVDVTLVVELSDEPPSTESQAALFDGFASSLGRAARASLRVVSTDELATPLGPAIARTFALPESRVRARVVAVPVCRAQGTIVIAALWSNEEGARAAAGFLGQLSTLGQDKPPVCDELDP